MSYMILKGRKGQAKTRAKYFDDTETERKELTKCLVDEHKDCKRHARYYAKASKKAYKPFKAVRKEVMKCMKTKGCWEKNKWLGYTPWLNDK